MEKGMTAAYRVTRGIEADVSIVQILPSDCHVACTITRSVGGTTRIPSFTHTMRLAVY